jgi:tryptophanase
MASPPQRPVNGLRFVEEPRVMRFFFGKLEPVRGDRGLKLTEAFRAEFDDAL